jgi:hypothetical protein
VLSPACCRLRVRSLRQGFQLAPTEIYVDPWVFSVATPILSVALQNDAATAMSSKRRPRKIDEVAGLFQFAHTRIMLFRREPLRGNSPQGTPPSPPKVLSAGFFYAFAPL